MAQFTAKMGEALTYFAGHKNKSAAYRHAYDCEASSARTVHRRAQELFRHPLMMQAVQQMDAVAALTVKVNSAWVLKRASLLADFNINTFIVVQEDGTAVYDFESATDDDWYCISEYTVDIITKGMAQDKYEVERVKLKTHCKIRALELVGKHTTVQAFKEVVEHTGMIGIASISTEEYKAARAEVLANDDC